MVSAPVQATPACMCRPYTPLPYSPMLMANPAPFTSPAAYERASISVPFGNCTEPSNVTAGGGSCPIRFQCAGCGFYRPDPSYLPALEQHIGRHMSGIAMPGGGVDWSFVRSRGLGL